MDIQKNDLITDYYAEQNRLLHEREPWGESGRKNAKQVREFSKAVGAKTILDYGCGRGTLKTALAALNFMTPVAEYDPAITGKTEMPLPADLVVCTDVMEHVEPEKIDNVLKHIHALSIRACYMVIATRDTQHILPDGRSSHLVIKPPEWWIKCIERAAHWESMESKIHINELNGKIKKVTLWLKK